ncbi:MAG: RNA methyltransferase [Candidatus Woesearchaeota archaeon]
MISIILIEPENPGNVGAVCRVMKNFGFERLIIVNPMCDVNSIEAIKRAKYAKELLKKAKMEKNLPRFDILIGTTGKLSNDYNIPRVPLMPWQLLEKLKSINYSKNKIGIIFGREGIGLTNQEIEKCDFILTIPTSKEYPIMNLSHAVAVILYELSKNNKDNIGNFPLMTVKEKEQLLKQINKTLDNLTFTSPDKKRTQQTIWKKLVGKSFLSKREAFALIGYFKKLNEKLK